MILVYYHLQRNTSEILHTETRNHHQFHQPSQPLGNHALSVHQGLYTSRRAWSTTTDNDLIVHKFQRWAKIAQDLTFCTHPRTDCVLTHSLDVLPVFLRHSHSVKVLHRFARSPDYDRLRE
eukprot:GHVH01011440.1.p1 GENE.GHVH01011440.1~~GHVH01011440.1.p1  ORF type:complete len:121 (+),score=1.26 GHVH01011440.1:1256-1618(+)